MLYLSALTDFIGTKLDLIWTIQAETNDTKIRDELNPVSYLVLLFLSFSSQRWLSFTTNSLIRNAGRFSNCQTETYLTQKKCTICKEGDWYN